MKVFLSWSGERSRRLAAALRDFLLELGLDPWLSDEELKPGDHWPAQLLDALRQCSICIACVTHASLRSGWMHFETGAVERRIALLLDLETKDLTGPLAQFQSYAFNRDELWTLVNRLDYPTKPDDLSTRFERHWPKLRDFDKEPIKQLFELERAADVPYLLARASVLWRENEIQREEAIGELIAEVRNLKSERKYLGRATDLIRENSVWAVCGHKTPEAWRAFLESNKASKAVEGRVIERVFFPPETHERESIHDAIKVHLERGMLVRVFPKEITAQSVYCDWNLPVGFGMTLMGEAKAGSTEPGTLKAVLVHWGGVGAARQASHYGVILKHPAWTDHFRNVFKGIIGLALEEPAKQKTLSDFLTQFRHYDRA